MILPYSSPRPLLKCRAGFSLSSSGMVARLTCLSGHGAAMACPCRPLEGLGLSLVGMGARSLWGRLMASGVKRLAAVCARGRRCPLHHLIPRWWT